MTRYLLLLFAITSLNLDSATAQVRQLQVTQSFSSAGGYYIANDPLRMLVMPQFVEELKLTEEQIESIRGVQQEISKSQSEAWQEIQKSRTNGTQVDYKMYQETQRKFREESQEKVTALLNDDQKSRLKELQIQTQLRTSGVGSLSGDLFADTLKLSEEQKLQLAKKQKEIQEELQRLMKVFKEEMEQEALDEVLTDEQTALLKKLTGKQYEFKRPDYSQFNRGTAKPTTTDKVIDGLKTVVDEVIKEIKRDE
ncbi:MAG: hypothetical protein O3B13_06550 [Planctomycetota bacterium]|nr:hypothetical protein [Planctomycetota bacterium]MDA1162742.1 hypothetical protein [Planctomycetota bacterium]